MQQNFRLICQCYWDRGCVGLFTYESLRIKILHKSPSPDAPLIENLFVEISNSYFADLLPTLYSPHFGPQISFTLKNF